MKGNTAKKNSSSNLLEQYHKLGNQGQLILQLLAIQVDSCSKSKLAQCLSGLKIKGIVLDKVSPVLVGKIVTPLEQKGLVSKTKFGLRCPDTLRPHVVLHALKTKEFKPLAKRVQKILPLEERYYGAGRDFTNPDQVLRELQIAGFTGRSAGTLLSIAHEAGQWFVLDEEGNDPFKRMLPHDMLEQFLPYMAEPTSIFLLQNILEWAMDTYHPHTSDYYKTLVTLQRSRIKKKEDCTPLLTIILLRGDCEQAGFFLQKKPWPEPYEQLAYSGWLAFITGDNQLAIDTFARALALYKKLERKRKAFLPDYPGVFHTLALIKSGDPLLMQQAYDQILLMDKDKRSYADLLVSWKKVLERQLGLPPNKKKNTSYSSHFIMKLNGTDVILQRLPLVWLDSKELKRNAKQLENIKVRASLSGFLWPAALAAELLAAAGVQRRINLAYCRELQTGMGTVGLTDMVEEKPEWEAGLEAIINLAKGGAAGKAKKTGEQRLIWWFDYDEIDAWMTLEPRLQKRGKTGKWTKGRPVALKTLSTTGAVMDGLTEQDRRVCGAIKQHVEGGGWGYSRRTVYAFNQKQALEQLVDHPLLFLPETTVPVELVQAEPELRIVREKENITIALDPSPEEDESYAVVQETGNRFLLYLYTERHQQLARTLGNGLRVPKQGEALARKAADSLSSIITVQSDIGGGIDARRVDADHTPHIQLLPMGKGLRVASLVKPFSTEGPSFHPGQGSKSVLAEIDGKKLRAVRDLKAEQQALDQLLEQCPTLARYEDGTGQMEIPEPVDCLEMLLELRQAGESVVLEWPKGRSYTVRSEAGFDKLALQINKDKEWFRASGKLQVDDDLVLDLQQLLAGLEKTTGRFIQLDDGSFLALTQAFRNRLQDLNAFSTLSSKGARFNPLASLALDDLMEEAGSCKGDAGWKKHVNRLKQPVNNPELPSTLQAELRPYQKEGFSWLSRLAQWGVGGCLADDMGLGKTLQALALMLKRAPDGPMLVVAPLSVIANWQEETRRFAPTLNVMIFGPGDRGKMLDELQPFDVVLVSYGLLPLEAEILQQVAWQVVVLDEAQAIKNRQTKRSRAAMGLQAEFRLITTGTPVENHLGELWTLFRFLNPGLLGSYKQFTEKFALPVEQDDDRESRDRLRRLIRPFILRRLKSDVLSELPPRIDVTLRVAMSTQEQALYEAKRRQAVETLESGEDQAGHLQILAEIMQLRRLCCNPALVLGDEAKKQKIASSKLKVFSDTVRELIDNKHKALVFSQFIGHLALIREYLDKQNISYQYLDGKTTAKQRQQRIAAFQAGEGDLFLISLKAGGSGLNLTAADYVIHMDPWWNPAVEDQASDRAHRIGQDRPVTVYRLVMEGTIEEQIVELHKKKRDLADSLLEGSDMSGRMSADDLLQLLRNEN